jgi:glycosyltransferase involved in cell wall biosynthesis
MAKITALLHTHNDAERIGRAVESLRACDEVLVVDHASTDDTVKIARDHGATVKEGVPGVNPGVYAIDARHDWVLCLLPNEAVGEALEASLFEWKDRKEEKSDQSEKDKQAANQCCGFSVNLREETGNGWKDLGKHTRLVNRKKINWQDHLPADDPGAELLPGHLLRFAKP